MGEGLQNHGNDREEVRKILESIKEGSDVRAIRRRFAKILKTISPEEIASIEQSLIQEGVPVEQVQKLCDIHVQVFEDALKRQARTRVIPGHPVHSYREENREAKKRLRTLKKTLKQALRGQIPGFVAALEDLRLIELHYIRKENQLFPFLERVGFTGPSRVMWGKHDEIRAHFSRVEKAIQSGNADELKAGTSVLVKAIRTMIFMEEKILFPSSLRKLPEGVWAHIRKGESAIGYAWIQSANLWDANIASARAAARGEDAVGPVHDASTARGAVNLSTGSLSPEQINLLLTNLPFDMTFVDENDKVAYYSEGKERIFPRSPGIIGRDVSACHPPKSVRVVEKIVKALKAGEKDKAEFWLQMKGMFIHIRYFPLFDNEGRYRGIIEVSQEVSEIRALEGERRLLDW